MKQKLEEIKNYFIAELGKAQNDADLKNLEINTIGKAGRLNEILKGLKNLDAEAKKEIWVEANSLKNFILDNIEIKREELAKLAFSEIEASEKLDVSLEFPSKDKGHMHPLSITSKLLEDIFISLGFKIEDGPQIEKEEYNFDKLNIPDNHPARDVWDTFWLSDDINSEKASWEKLLLRTHTSPVQVRTMLSQELPLKIIVPGRVFRFEQEDARHTSNFYQLEWLVVWEWVSFWDLKWTLDTVMKKLLWDDTVIRFRPSIFPFTEPSAEIDVQCKLCQGKWCRMCSGSGWVELLWAWMVHPKVLADCWVDPEKYSGFAFWMWIDRIASQRFSVSSSRLFYQSKLKLNEQF